MDKGKEKTYVHWTSEMDKTLSSVLLEEHGKGHKTPNGWKAVAFTAGIKVMKDVHDIDFTKEKIMARLKTWNKYYKEVSAMLDTSGFGWDWERNTVKVDSEEVWANYVKARLLLKSLVIIGAITGITLGLIGTTLPWLHPNLFTADRIVIGEMHRILLPYFISLMVTPSTHSLEGTLLAGRDLKFLSFSMAGCFCVGSLLVLLASSRGFGLPGCWWCLSAFQWCRFSVALFRLTSPHGMLYNEQFHQRELVRAKGA